MGKPDPALQEQDLVGVFACQTIRCQHRHLLDGAVAHGVAQRVEAGPVEPAAAVAFVAEDVLRGYDMLSRRESMQTRGGWSFFE